MRYLDMAAYKALPHDERTVFVDCALLDGLASNRDIKVDAAYNAVSKRASLIYKAGDASTEAIRVMAYQDHKRKQRITKQVLLKQFSQSLDAFERSQHAHAFGHVTRSLDEALASGPVTYSDTVNSFHGAIIGRSTKDGKLVKKAISAPDKMRRVWSLFWDRLPLATHATPEKLSVLLIPVLRYGSSDAQAGLIASLGDLHTRVVQVPYGQPDVTKPADIEHVVRKFAQSNKSPELLRDAANRSLAMILDSCSAANDIYATRSNVFEADGLWLKLVPEPSADTPRPQRKGKPRPPVPHNLAAPK